MVEPVISVILSMINPTWLEQRSHTIIATVILINLADFLYFFQTNYMFYVCQAPASFKLSKIFFKYLQLEFCSTFKWQVATFKKIVLFTTFLHSELAEKEWKWNKLLDQHVSPFYSKLWIEFVLSCTTYHIL